MGLQLQLHHQLRLAAQLAQLALQGTALAGEHPQLAIAEGGQLIPAVYAVLLQHLRFLAEVLGQWA
jgi:hypothetical protein